MGYRARQSFGRNSPAKFIRPLLKSKKKSILLHVHLGSCESCQKYEIPINKTIKLYLYWLNNNIITDCHLRLTIDLEYLLTILYVEYNKGLREGPFIRALFKIWIMFGFNLTHPPMLNSNNRQFERPLISRPPTHLNLNIVRILKSARIGRPSLTWYFTCLVLLCKNRHQDFCHCQIKQKRLARTSPPNHPMPFWYDTDLLSDYRFLLCCIRCVVCQGNVVSIKSCCPSLDKRGTPRPFSPFKRWTIP